MDIELNTLLVALMFVTILSMGIGNILVSLADILNHATSSRLHRLHVWWIFLLLIVHLNLFWNTKAILDNPDWDFGGFLLAIAGPVLLYFATSILLTTPEADDRTDLFGFYRRLGGRFFVMFAAIQVWVLITVYALSKAFHAVDAVNFAMLLLALVLSRVEGSRAHVIGLAAACVLAVASWALSWFSGAG